MLSPDLLQNERTDPLTGLILHKNTFIYAMLSPHPLTGSDSKQRDLSFHIYVHTTSNPESDMTHELEWKGGEKTVTYTPNNHTSIPKESPTQQQLNSIIPSFM